MANLQPEQPSFGMMTNGANIVFVKVFVKVQRSLQQYALSRGFSPFTSDREPQAALQILQHTGQGIRQGRSNQKGRIENTEL